MVLEQSLHILVDLKCTKTQFHKFTFAFEPSLNKNEYMYVWFAIIGIKNRFSDWLNS